MKGKIFLIILLIIGINQISFPQLIIDHQCTDIAGIPQSAIIDAKDSLHIAYGHTSHGSQVSDGMDGLVEFANNGGRGLTLPADIFAWNDGGTDGALDMHNNAMSGDVGYYPDWYNNTISYLEDEANSNVNVIMWSWCGQVGDKYSNGVLWDEYLGPMASLEGAYPEVVFVYMTGHLNYWNRENTNAANDSIRSFCRNNGKVLFDFADIESYSPEGICFKETGDDACDYYNSGGDSLGNWAVEYQNTHTEGDDWYYCGAQHSEPLNANLKAYAAWWMYASLGGWNYVAPPVGMGNRDVPQQLKAYPNPANTELKIHLDRQASQVKQIEVFSANGQLVKRMQADFIVSESSTLTMNVSDLSQGIYLLRLTTAAGFESLKFTVTH
jgi:hypothetical protein